MVIKHGRQVDHGPPRVLHRLPQLDQAEGLVRLGPGGGVLRHELRLDWARPEGHHGDSGLPQLVSTVCRHPVTAGLPNSVGDVEEVLQTAAGGDVDDETLLLGDHQPGGEGGANVVTSETHSVDDVPGVDGVHVPELHTRVGEDRVHSGVGVVDQHVQLAVLLRLDPLEELLHIGVKSMIHLDCDRDPSPGLDLLGTVIQVLLGPAGDVDGGTRLSQLESDPPADTPGGSSDQTDLALQGRRHVQSQMRSVISYQESIVQNVHNDSVHSTKS